MFRSLAALAALGAASGLTAGEQGYLLQYEYETSTQEVSGHGQSSSGGTQSLAEHAIATTAEGLEIEYSIPGDPDEVRGNDMWMYPARVLVRPDGSKRLLNESEIIARRDLWLDEAGWTKEQCGRWLFTWTAVKIECDPQAVLESIEGYGLRPAPLRPGTQFELPEYGISGLLEDRGTRNGRQVLFLSAPVDPQTVRDQEARTREIVAEISGGTLPVDDTSSGSEIDASGTIEIEFEIDEAGLVWKKTETVEMLVTGLDRGDEERTAKRTLTRIPAAEADFE
ncbi:hypothetical protein [Qipengyuania sp. JC766]|uniref:hypothetical protein n=1 Tax=Qipengyuania sp. JC766 TaxID=3232139 RepID=UPI0034586FE8